MARRHRRRLELDPATLRADGGPAGGAVGERLVGRLSGRVLAGFGSSYPDEPALIERRNPVYAQFLVRYRSVWSERTSMIVGFGAGVLRPGEWTSATAPRARRP